MSVNLFIATENSAFEGDNKGAELARILGTVAWSFRNGSQNGLLRDVNGNKVGMFTTSDFSERPPNGAFAMSFSTDNAAFEDGGSGAEIVSVIEQAQEKCRDDRFEFSLRDSNGNVVGSAFEFTAKNFDLQLTAQRAEAPRGGISRSGDPPSP